jgi:hypothetical protein
MKTENKEIKINIVYIIFILGVLIGLLIPIVIERVIFSLNEQNVKMAYDLAMCEIMYNQTVGVCGFYE